MAAPTQTATTAEPTARPDGPMLERCVATGRDEFARDVWGQRPLLTRAAELPRDFSDLLSAEMVDEIIAERGVRTPFVRMAREGTLVDRACFTRSGGFGAQMPDQIDPDGVLTQFADGATIVLQGLHRFWPPIIDFALGMTSAVGHPVQANAYVTPPANRGFDPHYDVHDVFVLQVAGSKQWRVHEPVHRHPLPDQPWTDHREAIEARADGSAVIDATLGPGDALYLPRGWIHSAQAQGDISIHLTVGVAPLTGHDLVRAVLAGLAEDESLRASLPLGFAPATRDRAEPQAQEIIEAMGKLLSQNKAEYAKLASVHLASRYRDLTRAAPVRPLATLDAIAELAPATPVRWRTGLHGSLTPHGSKTAVLALPTKSITFPAMCVPALRTVLQGAPVRADGLPGLDASDGMVLLRRLLREAVVVAS